MKSQSSLENKSQPANDTEEFLDFTTVNSSSSSTILLLHGAGASGHDWDVVIPHLPSHHLLMPSLFTRRSLGLANKHRTSGSLSLPPTKPCSWASAYVYLLHNLVLRNASNGQVHIVGLSMGASLAVKFAQTYPSSVLSVFVSGLPTLSERGPESAATESSSLIAYGLFVALRLQEIPSVATVKSLLDNEVDLHNGGWDGEGRHATLETTKIVMDICRGCQPVWINIEDRKMVRDGPLRINIVAATRTKWWMPTGDSTHTATRYAQGLVGYKKVSKDSRVHDGIAELSIKAKSFEAPNMFHPWSRQAPKTFADCILATLNEYSFPTGINELWPND